MDSIKYAVTAQYDAEGALAGFVVVHAPDWAEPFILLVGTDVEDQMNRLEDEYRDGQIQQVAGTHVHPTYSAAWDEARRLPDATDGDAVA